MAARATAKTQLRIRIDKFGVPDISTKQYGSFVRFYHGCVDSSSVGSEITFSKSDIGSRRWRTMHSLLEKRGARSGGVEPCVGGIVFAHLYNEEGRDCVTIVGTFCVTFSEIYNAPVHTGRVRMNTFRMNVVNYAAADAISRNSGLSPVRGTITFSVEVAAADGGVRDFSAAQPMSVSTINRCVFEEYVHRYYAVCIARDGLGDGGPTCSPTQPKLEAYHVPYFVTYSGAKVPASASLLWRPAIASETQFARMVHAAISAAARSYPEVGSYERLMALVGELTTSSTARYVKALSVAHSAALRAAFEVLSQLATAFPYLADFAYVRRNNGGGWVRVDDDVFCPITETEGSDCEDGAQYIFRMKRLIEARPRIAPALSALYKYYSQYIAISYCADDHPEQSTEDGGLCHVVCILMPKTAARAIVKSSSCALSLVYPSLLDRSDHWIRSTGLVVLESTALTDPLVFPLLGRGGMRYRIAQENAKSRIRAAMASDSRARGLRFEPAFMDRNTFVEFGQSSLATEGYCASGFYQWFTDLWTDECVDTLDYLPLYSDGTSATWGVRAKDLSAQVLLSQRSVDKRTLTKYFGSACIARVSRTPIAFVPRAKISRASRRIIEDVVHGHLPPYKLFPDRVDAAVERDCDFVGRAAKVSRVLHALIAGSGNRALAGAFRTQATDTASYVRVDLYASDFETDCRAGFANTKAFLADLNLLYSRDTNFYAFGMSVQDIYPGRRATKISLFLFYRMSGASSAVAVSTAHRRGRQSKVGKFN